MIYFVYFQVIDWLVTEGEELLSHHQDVCDNLKGIKAQQKDFDKLYFSAMVRNNHFIATRIVWATIHWDFFPIRLIG